MSLETVRLPVMGMTCGGCARSVERKLTATQGVAKAQVDLDAAAATVEFDPARAQVADLKAAIEQLGFQVK